MRALALSLMVFTTGLADGAVRRSARYWNPPKDPLDALLEEQAARGYPLKKAQARVRDALALSAALMNEMHIPDVDPDLIDIRLEQIDELLREVADKLRTIHWSYVRIMNEKFTCPRF